MNTVTGLKAVNATDSTMIVCIVDDDEGIRTGLSLLLEAHGWPVRCFDSAEALIGSRADLDGACLVLDLAMPGMDGATLLEHLRARGRVCPAIVLTAYPDGALARRARAAGARMVLPKPIGIATLVEEIARIVAERPASG